MMNFSIFEKKKGKKKNIEQNIVNLKKKIIK